MAIVLRMPSRTREHILEDESRVALVAALGDEFVLRAESPDYGIDGEVEFMPGGDPSGLRFKVQIKATDDEDLTSALVVPLKTDRIRQYIAQHMPVLMIRYQAPSKSLFARWFHEARFGAKVAAQRSASFRWTESDRWTPATPAALVNEARANLALRSAQFELPIDATLSGGDPRWTYRGFQQVRRAASPVGDIVQLVEEPTSTVSAAFSFAPGELSVAVAKTAHASMDIPEDHPGLTEPEAFASDCLTLLAVALAIAGHANLAGRIARRVLAASSLASHWDAVAILAAAMVQARQVRESLELADALGDLETAPDGPSVMLTFVGMALSGRLTAEENIAVRVTLERRHERTLAHYGEVAASRTAINILATITAPAQSLNLPCRGTSAP